MLITRERSYSVYVPPEGALIAGFLGRRVVVTGKLVILDDARADPELWPASVEPLD